MEKPWKTLDTNWLLRCFRELFFVEIRNLFVAYFASGEDFLAPADKVKRAFWLMPEVWSLDQRQGAKWQQFRFAGDPVPKCRCFCSLAGL